MDRKLVSGGKDTMNSQSKRLIELAFSAITETDPKQYGYRETLKEIGKEVMVLCLKSPDISIFENQLLLIGAKTGEQEVK